MVLGAGKDSGLRWLYRVLRKRTKRAFDLRSGDEGLGFVLQELGSVLSLAEPPLFRGPNEHLQKSYASGAEEGPTRT